MTVTISPKGTTAISHPNGSVTFITKDGKIFHAIPKKNGIEVGAADGKTIIKGEIIQGNESIIIKIDGGTKTGLIQINPDGSYEAEYKTGSGITKHQRGTLPPIKLDFPPAAPPKDVGGKLQDAVTFSPRDPLALDLDNDGIEVIGINPSSPILFDHNGDGAPSATGWLKGDDGWLVRDLDGDGKITSGKELLGVDTDITVGGVTRKAASGFEALRALDTHQDGDGKNLFDSRDAAFSQLRVWQDKNQNGVTDTGELSTLAALGIVSIQLQESATNVDLGGGNGITGKAKVTRRIGASTSTSELDSVLVTNDAAANLNLADNPFYTDLPDVQINATAQALPNMQGSGLVHGLREAMSLGTASSSTLTATVQAFAAANTRDAQMALLDKLITEWGATSTLTTSGLPATGGWTANATAPNPTLSADTQQRIKTFAQSNPEMYRKVIVLEQFNGQMGLAPLMNRWNVTLPIAVTNSLNAAYTALRESVYGALVTQTRLKPYMDAIELVMDDQGLRFDLTKLSALITSTKATDISKAITDVLELNQFAGDTMFTIGFDGSSTMRNLLLAAPSSLPLLSQLPTLGLFQAGATSGTSKNDMYLGDQGNNSFRAGDGSDLLSGSTGNDTLYGETGNDTLDGGSGNDNLRGGADADVYLFGTGDGQDTIYNSDTNGVGVSADAVVFKAGISPIDVTLRRSGSDLLIRINGTTDNLTVSNYFNADATTGYAIETLRFADSSTWDIASVMTQVLQSTASDDTLTGYASHDSISGNTGNDVLYGEAGNDTLDGGSGNDSLGGGAGADMYIFGKGDGLDSINNNDSDALGTAADTIQFRAGVSPTDVSLRRSGSDLLIRINSTTDSLTVSNYFNADATTSYAIETLRFADGTTWDISSVKTQVLQSTTGNDTLTGYATPDSISGGAGNDTLYGEAGDDTLDGGSGNDNLFGGAGADTYLFGRNDGQDTISTTDEFGRGAIADRILFKVGVTPADVSLRRSESDLLITINGTTDSLTVSGYFLSDATTGYALDALRFADGTTWDIPTVKAKVLQGTTGNDALTGYATHDGIDGGAGNDTLFGTGGNDTLDGGSGNDDLYGDTGSWDSGTGADVYLFGKGSGKDTIYNRDADPVGINPDTILLGSGITAADVILTSVKEDLIIRLNGTSDTLLVKDYFHLDGASSATVENIKFADGTAWNYVTVKRKALVPTPGDDILHGDATNETINSGTGNDTVYGYAGDDVLDGGTGADHLEGGDGNDALQGSEHNDELYGGAGADTLKGGTGIDTLYGGGGNDLLQGNEDTDHLIGDDGNDTLDGGSGNDDFRGGAGADVYLFGKGSGQDTIYNQDSDAVGTNPDTILLGAGITAADVTLTSANDDLVIRINGTSDSLLVDDYFYNNGASNRVVESLKFADGITWDVKTVLSKLSIGTNGADVLYGTPNADVIDGKAGNDTIHAGLGSDTYIFGKGDGRDVIGAANDTIAGKIDTLLFKPGVTPNEVIFGTATDPLNQYATIGNSLVIKIVGTSDQITIQDFLYDGTSANTRNPLQQIRFDDGTTWNLQAILSKLYAGTDFADRIDGTLTGDLIKGGAGADSLYGEGGGDTLDGGVDNDYIVGGAGNDIYLFGKGDGQDTIGSTLDNDGSEANTLLFKSGVLPSEVTLSTSYSDLVIKITNLPDRIFIKDFLYEDTTQSAWNPLQRIKFADATAWNIVAILDKLYAGTDAADEIKGTYDTEVINGQGGNDFLYGQAGDDTLNGGAGNDYIDSGVGNDYLNGGIGDDTYFFEFGAGQDIVDDDDATVGNVDRIQFGTSVSSSSIQAVRSGDALLLKITGSSNQIKIDGYFVNDASNNHLIEEIRFAREPLTAWKVADIKARVLQGTSANDTLVGYASADSLSGGSGADLLQGRGGDDTLDGNSGIDTMIGGAGNDLYVVDVAQDQIIELADGGFDSVNVWSNYVVSDHIEYAGLQGTANLTLTGNNQGMTLDGNEGNNLIRGGDGADTLDGFGGQDTLSGGKGNDLYYVDNLTTRIEEAAGAGTDSLWSYVDNIALSDNVENLYMAGRTVISGAGNGGDNRIFGNGLNNVIRGEAGNDRLLAQSGDDTLYGGAGIDNLFGGEGNDVYVLNRGDGDDIIYAYDTVGADTLQINGASKNDIWLTQAGADLEIYVLGQDRSATIGQWFGGKDYQLDQIRIGDSGPSLRTDRLQGLIQAMASMPPPGSMSSLPPADLARIQGAINTAWA